VDRYLDNNLLMGNVELRFPIYGVLGGIIGHDIGQVSRTPTLLKLNRWASNPVVGLNLSIRDFIARTDPGFGKDGTGFYFNFGHAF